METLTHVKAYSEAVREAYKGAGWLPFPLPHGAKFPPPKGLTGAQGVYTEIQAPESSNVGIRLPKGVVGIDVDSYKDDASDFRNLVSLLGELPETYSLSSRGMEQGAGTRFFRLSDPSLKLKGSHGSIDVIQHHHRYAVAAPSKHPSGAFYGWYKGAEPVRRGIVPSVDSIPFLPPSWEEFFTASTPSVNSMSIDKDTGEVRESLGASVRLSDGFTGSMCLSMRSSLSKGLEALTGGMSRHEGMVKAVFALVSHAGKGHTGLNSALEALEDSYTALYGANEGKDRQLSQAFQRAVQGAMSKVSEPDNQCSCSLYEGRKETEHVESAPTARESMVLLYGFALREARILLSSSPEEDPRDLVQEAYLKILKMDKLPETLTQAYIKKTLTTVNLDRLKKRQTFILSSLESLTPSTTPTEHDCVPTDVFRKLSPILSMEEKSILWEIFAGYKQKEIANNMGISSPAVNKKIKAMTKKIRDAGIL